MRLYFWPALGDDPFAQGFLLNSNFTKTKLC
jgi:hypothetical protein